MTKLFLCAVLLATCAAAENAPGASTAGIEVDYEARRLRADSAKHAGQEIDSSEKRSVDETGARRMASTTGVMCVVMCGPNPPNPRKVYHNCFSQGELDSIGGFLGGPFTSANGRCPNPEQYSSASGGRESARCSVYRGIKWSRLDEFSSLRECEAAKAQIEAPDTPGPSDIAPDDLTIQVSSSRRLTSSSVTFKKGEQISDVVIRNGRCEVCENFVGWLLRECFYPDNAKNAAHGLAKTACRKVVATAQKVICNKVGRWCAQSDTHAHLHANVTHMSLTTTPRHMH